jgi:hypothetical protein
MSGSWGDRDSQDLPSLPVRNGNTATPATGLPVIDGTEPMSSVDPGGTGRLPVPPGPSSQGPQFTNGTPNVRGGDGPSATSPAHEPNGGTNGTNGLPGPSGNGPAPDVNPADAGRPDSNWPDASGGVPNGAGSGWVAVPSPGLQQRLPIFDSLESDWFRRSGQPLAVAARAQGPQGGQGAQGPASVPSVTQGSWTSPSDEGWRAAQAVAEPAAGETTQAGLPRRVPRANLVPGSVGGGGAQGGQDSEAGVPVRSPDAVRSRMSGFQRGVREGRAVAPPQNEESQD